MTITIRDRFQSDPNKVRMELMAALTAKAPDLAGVLGWNAEGTRATGKKMGASVSVNLLGAGPTDVSIDFSIGFPASMKFNEKQVEAMVAEALREMKARVP